ncbi:prepilin-type N-terminal cleavage/methylation domain-containing protein [Pandoraea fibrosis]|uniref:Prepilin-type N-terminal cleavage/methylation domain-containing protein n=1 Tax=Pandoraea fibrosis TaxID=1891094 RepID=A0ABX6HKK1_9BURK|nr:type II secretion system protein [Pandoraea fibrosis]QHE90549.1 prepilin-type N-terminal cleavage/methylation domain-containing protein [Pandoraea fibrosis]QHF11381.1 prepilin-type N-terminal cleavage/methylation domain-containing protein [Pandoraea fibrosis]
MNMQVNGGALVQMKSKMVSRLNKRRQRGVTLVELSVAVAVMGLIMAGAMVGVPRLMNSVRVNQEIKDWQMAVVSVQNAVMSGQLNATTTMVSVHDLGIFGSMQRIGTTNNYLNRFGGTVTPEVITSGGGNLPTFGLKIQSKDLPSEQCQRLFTSMHPSFATIKVNNTELKTMTTSFAMNDLATACRSSAKVGDTDGQNDVTKADVEFTIGGA